jgi:hypothetical protein
MPSVPRSPLKWTRVESGIRKRTNDDGSTVYEVRVRRKGAPAHTLTCPTLPEARKQRDMARSQAWEGKHTQRAEDRRKTVAGLCEALLKARYSDRMDHSQDRTHQGHCQWWCARMGEYRVSRLTPQDLVKYREELLTRVTPTTCQRYLASLSSTFTWAIRNERQWMASNPVRLVTKPQDQRPLNWAAQFVALVSTEELPACCRAASRSGAGDSRSCSTRWSRPGHGNGRSGAGAHRGADPGGAGPGDQRGGRLTEGPMPYRDPIKTRLADQRYCQHVKQMLATVTNGHAPPVRSASQPALSQTEARRLIEPIDTLQPARIWELRNLLRLLVRAFSPREED